MTPKISDFVIQYQDSEGLRRSIPYAVELLAKEREKVESQIRLFASCQHVAIAAAALAEREADLQKIEQAEAILVRLGYRAETGAWKVHA